jgi:hypothetical protein
MYVCIMHQCIGVGTSYGSWLGLTIPAYWWDVTEASLLLKFCPIPPCWRLSNGKLGLPPSGEALIRMKTIVGVHARTCYGAIASHMTCLTS